MELEKCRCDNVRGNHTPREGCEVYDRRHTPAVQWWEGGRKGRDLAKPVAVRLPVGLAGDVERKAAEVGLRTSGQLRRMVEYANQNMPKEWGL